MYFDFLHLVTERSSHRRWSIMFLKTSQISQENNCAEVSTYQFNSQSMSRPDKRWKQVLEVFCKKGVLKNLANFAGKHLCWSLFLIKLQQIRSATLLMLSCEICEIFKNTYFEEHLPTNVSLNERQQETYESYLVNPVLYPDVFSYRWIGMGAQKLSTNFLE